MDKAAIKNILGSTTTGEKIPVLNKINIKAPVTHRVIREETKSDVDGNTPIENLSGKHSDYLLILNYSQSRIKVCKFKGLV